MGSPGRSTQKEQLSTSPTKLTIALTGLDHSLLAEVMRERIVGRILRLFLVLLDDAGNVIGAALQFMG